MPRATLKAVNAALQAKGHKVELVRGKGYFYFAGFDVSFMRDTMVLATRLSDFTTEEWVAEFEHKKSLLNW